MDSLIPYHGYLCFSLYGIGTGRRQGMHHHWDPVQAHETQAFNSWWVFQGGTTIISKLVLSLLVSFIVLFVGIEIEVLGFEIFDFAIYRDLQPHL